MQPTPEYGFVVKLDVAYDEAVRRTTAALKEEGSVVSVVDPVAMLWDHREPGAATGRG